MRIEKEYDVQEFANKVKEKIEKCRNCGTKHVGIDIITAQEIVDVLENLMVEDTLLHVRLVNTKNSVRN